MDRIKFDFSDKRVFVSGSTSGIGAAAALLFARSGATVVVHGRDAGRAEAMASRVRAEGGTPIIALGALDSDTDCAAIAEAVNERIGGVDILVCNAADHQPYTPDWFSAPPSAWLTTYDRNVGGSVRLIQAFAPAMRDRGWGRIVLIGSSSYYTPIPDFPTYGPSKAATVNLMVNLTAVLTGTGVTVNTISPGSVLTETMRSNLPRMAEGNGWTETDPEVIERRLVAERWPNAVGRMGRPDEIAAAIAFVASEESAFMTGAHIRINGGERPSLH
jgi:NAD(P)-dependent dehydrogenase (short-subunit alcohol dehydrogenase family)